MPRAFGLRGIVEGFYGRPWSHDARCAVLSFVAPLGMNAYVYAPKDDPFHRARWRDAYPDDAQAEIASLAAHARSLGVRFGFAISPGLDIEYESQTDRAQLAAKLAPLLDAGVDWFVLALDDIPFAPGLAGRQAALASWLHDHVCARLTDAIVTVCPTEYVGTRPSPYLGELAAGMPADVSLLWTGPTVCSPVVTVDDAKSWIEAVAPHDVMLWDNYPVNDGTMSGRLHLGPYEGRDAALADLLSGVLLNPMNQAYASLVALGTAARFLAAPDDYEPQHAWATTIEAVGGPAAAPLRALAETCADSALRDATRLELARLVDTLEDALDSSEWAAAARELSEVLRVARKLPTAFDSDLSAARELASEVGPWAAAAAREAAAGRAAIRLIEDVHAAEPDAEKLLQLVFGVLFSWSGARANTEVVFGPRFAIYPAVVQTPAGRPAVDVGLALLEDANVIDRLCRLALREYERWRLS